jgi:ketosteroid isomerase-like protein
MLDGFRDVASVWEDYQTEVDEYRELDGERVLVLVHWSGRGKTSGLDLAQIETNGASLFQVRNAKVTKLVRYFDREHALADLGRAPEGGSQR